MNPKYQELYKYLKGSGMTDLDENSFYNKYSDPANSKELWSYLKNSKMTDLDENSFHASYFGGKKKEVSQSTLDQDNTSSDRLSKTTTKPTVSSSLKGEGVYTIPGQAEGVFFKKQADGWYKKQYGVFDYKKVTDPNRIKKIEANTVEYKPQPKEELYILDSNPNALYKRSGNKWMKKIGGNYVPLTGDKVSERENILNEQARKATKFDLDRMSNYAPDVEQKAPVNPIKNEELKKSFEEKYGDIKVLEKEMEQKRLEELNKPAPVEKKFLNWRYGAGKIFDFDDPASVEAFKNISPSFYMDYYDSHGNPIGIMDAEKMKLAEENMKKDFGENEFKAYHSIADIPSREKLASLGEGNAAKLLNSKFQGTNIRFYQDGSEIRVVSKIGEGINEEILNEKTFDLNYSGADKYIKSFAASNLLKKSEKEKFDKVSSLDDLVEIVGTNPYKFPSSLLDGIDVDTYYSNKRRVLEGELARSKADTYQKDSEAFSKEVESFNTQVKGGKMSQQEFETKSAELEAKRKELESRRRIISNTVNEAEKIDNITNNLYKANVIDSQKKEQEGSFLGIIGRQFGQGLTNVSKTALDFTTAAASLFTDAETFANSVSPGSYQNLKNLGYTDEEIKNETQKQIKSAGNKILEDVPDVFGGGTTKEYIQSKDRGLIEQAVGSLAESFGTMAGGVALSPGSKLATNASFFAMSYNAMEDQMRGPAFDGLSENEKKIISLPYGLIIGQLEKYGAKVGLSAADSPILNKFSNYLMSKVFTSLPKNASILEVKSAIDKSVAASIASGMIKITGAGIVEGGTEFTQQIFEGIEKDIANRIIQSNQLDAAGEKYDGQIPVEIVNQIKENKFFKDAFDLTTGEGISQLLSQSVDAFNLGFLAGGIGGTISVGVKDPILNKISNNRFKIYKDLVSNDEARNGLIASINAKVESGKLTRVEADQQIKSIEDSYPVIMRIPDNLSTSAQREAFSLIAEKDKLERDIIGKDPALVAKQKDRITEINEQLKTTSYAVQEQTTTEQVTEEVVVEEEKVQGKEVKVFDLDGKKYEVTNESTTDLETGNLVPMDLATQIQQEGVLLETKPIQVKEVTEVAPKAEIGGIIRGYESISEQDNVGDVRSQLPNQNQGTAVVEGKDGNQYAVAFSRKGGDGKNIFEQGVTTPRPGYISASVKIEENATPEQVQAAQQEAQRNLDIILPTVVGGAINAQAINDVMAQQAPIVQEETVTAPEMGATADIEAQKADIEKRRKPLEKGLERISKILDGDGKIKTEEQAVEILNEVHRFRKNHKKNGLATKEELAQMDEFEQEAKDNFGLEIVSQLGKKYDERENIDVINFNTIENSQGDERIIIAEIKPQINKNGVLAQRASVDVLQGLSRQQFDAELAALETTPTVAEEVEELRAQEQIEQKKNLVSSQKETNLAPDETGKQKAGNRLFNEPLKAVAEIANRYYERIFGSKRPKYEGTTELNTERSKRIAAAFEAMKHEPNNPEVKKAYEAMAKETIDQYQDFLDAGYVVEINNEEPYANSADMIEDLRKNKRIKIFSTESGFGDDPITPEQRAENPLLATTEFTDVNGQPMLVNDLFRAVHDFFGHAELGNSFGPKGEENAWNVHSRMYSPLARRAMTTETRGQNSWVNFSGFNDEIQKLRDKAAKLRDEGKIDEAAEVVGEIYDKFKFADQKIGLLPIEFSEVDQDIEDVLQADTKDATNLEKVLNALDKIEGDLDQFGKETLGVNIPVATMRAIIKAAKVLVKTGITLQDAIIKAAEKLNVSKQDALNAVKFMSETIKSPVKKVSVNEAAALKDQLRLEARAAREAKTDLNTKRKQIATFIRSLETKGTITARQAAALVKRVSSLNLDNETMVERFEQYAEKVFQRAEYQDLLTKAFRTRRLIRKAIKSENQAEVVGMAKLFSKIDPSLVDDIDNYIALAENVLNAVRPSKQAVQDPALRQAVNIEAVAEYANEEIAKQEENRKRELMSEYKYLVDSGAITEDLSVKEMKEIISIITDPTAEFDPEADQKKLNFLQTRLASMEAVFKYMLSNNINPFTGEDVVIDPKDADLINRVLKMDLNEMSVKDAAKVVEAMDNFLMNDITSGLEAAVRSYEGAQNAKQLVDQGKKARTLKSYFNKTVGRIFGEQFISLPLLFEKMFPGIKNAANVMQKMGLVDVINGSNKAIRQHNDLMTEYSKQDFYKQKGFMEAKNVYERGMLAFLKRNLIGTKTEIRDEFKRRAEIIKQSIESLRENGTDKEIQMADLYQEIYDKLDVAKLDLDVIEANADKMNKDAVAWMVNEWGKHYGDLADISLSVYNSMLGSDTNYTPDRYKSLSAEDQGLDEALLNSGSGFMMSMDYTDKNKTGVLMEATRPKVLPKGRYISLDFDVNNFNSIKGALVDINTAAAIRQVDGFTKSKAFNKLIPDAKDRKILTKRINTYIQKAKGKRTVTSDTIKDVERLANFVTGLGVGKALGGLDQPIKQTIPVIINTFINSNGNMNFVSADMNEAINRSGMPIANRGLESRTAVESIDRLLEKTGGFGAEVIKKLEDVNQFWLKTLLAKPDVWVARSSFITYYLKDMKSKGENVKDIDWSKHEWNKDSAEYAQLMVDRQQNISDDKLAGDFLSSDDPTKRIARKVIMPFATFIMNQKARMHNDLLALRSKDTSIQDRKLALKSLAGLGAELVSYQLIAYGIKTLVYNSIANALAGDDEEEKKDKSFFGLKMTTKQFNATKFPVKSIVGDILSPLPFFDDIVTMGFDKTMEYFPQISNEDINKAVEEKNAILRLKGENEMDANARAKFIEQLKSDNIYSVSFKNDSQSGRAYGMIGIAYDTYKEMIDLSEMAYSGEFEDEYQGRVIKKYLPEEDRKILQNISVPLMILYSTGIAPKDLGTVARKVTNIVKKKGITENQHEKEKEVKKQINRDLSKWEFELVKTRKKSDGVVNEINYVESKGGLNDKQGKEYVKLMEVFPSPSDDMLRDIQNGKTADQIIKKSKG